ncbi:hypothetical protein C6501_03820 [Candidatus Poribacteria bacterium]|nr:MAG: hypothetical protein C6501_03820 [Candidatus Poribacteria bacterium]
MLRATQKAKLNCTFIFCCSLSLAILVGCQNNTLDKIEVLIHSGRAREALEKLGDFIETDPKNPRARMLLGKAYNEVGRNNDAIEQFQKASQLFSGQPEKRIAARMELARTYLIFGDRDSAFRILNTVQKGTSDSKVLQKIIELVGDSYKTKQLTHGNFDNYSPIFSPDGTQIAFASFRLDNSDIYLMNLEGQIQRRVTFTTDFNDSSPAFLKTPNYIFYSSEPKASREVKIVLQSSGSTPIYTGFNITHIHSKITRSVVPISFGARVPRASPSGNQIVYESNTDKNLELYLLDLNELNLTQITPEKIKPKRITHNETDEGSPTFFPDGKRIVFVSSRNDVHQLYTMNIDGQNEKHFNPNRYDCYNPTVSPDGKTIAYVSTRDSDWEIYLIDANGKNERKITSDIGRSIQPTFSPDGRYIAFVSDRSDNFHIYLMDLNKPTTREDLVKRLQR